MATKHSNQKRTTPMAQKMKPATTFTADVNKAALAKYAMQDWADFHDVDRGFIAGFGDRLVSDDGTKAPATGSEPSRAASRSARNPSDPVSAV